MESDQYTSNYERSWKNKVQNGFIILRNNIIAQTLNTYFCTTQKLVPIWQPQSSSSRLTALFFSYRVQIDDDNRLQDNVVGTNMLDSFKTAALIYKYNRLI